LGLAAVGKIAPRGPTPSQHIMTSLSILRGTAIALFTAATVKDCAPGSSLFTINAASIQPPSPTPGEVVNLHLEYSVPEGVDIMDGTTTYAVTYNFIPFRPTVEPLCQNIPCPLGPGFYTNNTQSLWPDAVSGTFNSRMTWKDVNNTLLLCLDISGKV
jgi:hypothetical protein